MVRERFRNYDGLYLFKADAGHHFEGVNGENHGGFIISSRMAKVREVEDRIPSIEDTTHNSNNDNAHKPICDG